MRRAVLLLLPLVLALPASAGEFSQFRIPDHHAHRYVFDVSGNGDRSRQTRSSNADEQSSWNGSLRGNALWIDDTDARQWQLEISGWGNGDRRHELGLQSFFDQRHHEDIRRRHVDEALSISASVRTYPRWAPVALGLSLSGDQDDRQDWTHELDREAQVVAPGDSQVVVSSRGDWSYLRGLAANVSIGVGHVRDASVVHVAIVLEKRWLDDQTLRRPLSPGARTKLAQLLSERADFGIVHDRPEKAFWADVEALLRDDGALAADRLDAYSVIHALDPVLHTSALGADRPIGFFVGAYAGDVYEHSYYRSSRGVTAVLIQADTVSYQYSGHSELGRHYDDHFYDAGFLAEYHRAWGYRSQLDGVATIAGDGPRPGRNYVAQATLRARWWVGERWIAGASFSQTRRFVGDRQSDWDSSLGGSVDYYLEDRWTIGLDASTERWRTATNLTERDDHRDSGIHLALGWNRGALDAPGLIAPVRPLN
jgi:hypothetical protein